MEVNDQFLKEVTLRNSKSTPTLIAATAARQLNVKIQM